MMNKEDIELSMFPSKAWEKFITEGTKFNDIDVSKWQAKHLLGYWCFKFKQAFNKDYQWKFNASPSKCYELFRLNTVCSRLSSKPDILKQYIDWIFDQRVEKDKKVFRSIAFITADDQCQWYREHILFAGSMTNIDRSTALPNDIQSIVDILGCKTYGDLAFLMKANIQSEAMIKAINDLKDRTFDFTILDKIV